MAAVDTDVLLALDEQGLFTTVVVVAAAAVGVGVRVVGGIGLG